MEGKSEKVLKETYLDIVRKKWYFLPSRPMCFLHFLVHNYTRTHKQAHKACYKAKARRQKHSRNPYSRHSSIGRLHGLSKGPILFEFRLPSISTNEGISFKTKSLWFPKLLSLISRHKVSFHINSARALEMRSKFNNHLTWKIQIQRVLGVLLNLTQRNTANSLTKR